MEGKTILEQCAELGFVPAKGRRVPQNVQELAVAFHVSGQFTPLEISKALQICTASLHCWRRKISPRTNVKPKKEPVSYYERRRILKAVGNGEMTKIDGMRQLGVTHAKINLWLEDQNLHLSYSEYRTTTMGKKQDQNDDALRQEIVRLSEALAQEKLKVEGLQIMIETAEKELKVNIRKKSGTK